MTDNVPDEEEMDELTEFLSDMTRSEVAEVLASRCDDMDTEEAYETLERAEESALDFLPSGGPDAMKNVIRAQLHKIALDAFDGE